LAEDSKGTTEPSSAVVSLEPPKEDTLSIDLSSSPDQDNPFVEQESSMAQQQQDSFMAFMKHLADQEAKREEREARA